ncbi:uDP-N-acetylmuramoyl-L-alanyl-D-glutamate--2 6-diaminopimelate ligase [Clostridium sp. CAG:567]|jgi:UDP-N-acetylmuramyl-tripeptide synthetase|nr:uDP-N-acetylmuramoyl-L-alanyl-D-glutamate--2 6-diaminopimelate ligase [Clostridium sp. CAG:567]
MKRYLLKDYIDILKKENLVENVCLCDNILNTSIEKLEHNSKEVANNTLYICKGLNYKPEYLNEAIVNGATAYIAEPENVTNPDFPHIVVNDIRKALAAVSCMYYDFPADKINMIGLTGTKGKSTTAYYIKSILDDYMKEHNLPDTAIVSSIDTYDGKECKESLITSPESIDLQEHIANAVDCKMQNLVMEVSSQALKLDRVHDVLYKVGVFLNISEDHISTIEHPNFEDYFAYKLKFFAQVENACVNLDSDYIDRILENAQKSKKIITFSTKNEKADVFAYDIKKLTHTSISFRVKTAKFDEEILLTMPGLFNVENALAAIATAMVLDIPFKNIYNGLKVARASGRMEAHVSKDGNIIVIVDYAHNKLSFQKLYESTKQEYPDKNIITVFGCPGGKAQLRRRDLGTLSGIHSKVSYLTAEDPGPEETVDICKEIAEYVAKEHGNYKIIEDRGEAIKEAILDNPNSVVLITGKGNETRQKYGKKYLPCLTDTQYALEALEEYDKKIG